MALMKGSSQSDLFAPALVPGPASSSGRTPTTTTPAAAAGSSSAREQQREHQLGLEEEYYRDEEVGHGARFRRCERLLQDGERVEGLDFRTYDSLELGQGGGDRSGVLLEHEGSLMDIGGGGGEEDEDFSAAGPQGDEFDYMPRVVGHDGTEHEGFGQFGQVDDRLDEAGGASNLPVATEESEREAWIPQGIVTSNFPMGSDGDSIFDEAIRDLMNNSSQAAAAGEYGDTAGKVDIDGLDDDDPHELHTAPEAPDGMDFTIEDVEGGVSGHEEVVGLRQDVAAGCTTEFDSRGMDAASTLPDQALFVTEEDTQFVQAEDEVISESRLTRETSISGHINCADSPGKYTVEEAVAADGSDCGQRPYWPTTFEQELYASLPQQDAEFLLAAAEQCPDSPEISDSEPHQTEGTFLDPLENEGSSKNGHSSSSEECKDDSNPQNEGTSDRDETLDEGADAVVAGQESDEDGNVGLDDQGAGGRGNSPPPSVTDGLESKGGARVSHPALQHTSSAGCARTTAAEVLRGQPDRTLKQHPGNCVRQSSDARTFAKSQDLAKGKTAIEPPNEGEGGPLWVKWRGKWEAAIRCSVLDCPPSTLKAKPNYSKKKHVVVYFPSARLFSWVDTQHTCPIGESPAPLLAGTHFSQREAVKDDNLPRKRMLIKLGGEILDISDRLHIKAVVPFAQDVKVWKTFAKEAAAATTYSELGELLVRLHLTIAPVYIKPRWMDQRYASWKEDCAKSASAANLQKLTRELINNVRWEDVTPLWNAPEQPELDPEWEHWKGDAFDEKDSDDDSDARPGSRAPRDHSPIGAQLGAGSGSKRFKEQARARRQSQLSPDTPDTPQKRLKINSVSPEVQFSGGPGSSSFGHATTAFRSPLVHLSPLVQGKGSEGPVASNSGLCTAFLKRKNRRCNRPQKEDITYCGKHKHLADPENRGKELESEGGLAWESGLCSASLGQQFTRCDNQTSEGSIFCQTHIHLGTVQSADTNDGDVDFSASSSKEDRCHGITTRGIQCTHKPRDGSPFCVKHSTQQDDEIEGRVPFQGPEGSASKRARIPNDIAKTNGSLVQVQVSRAGSHHGIPGMHGNGLMQRSNDGKDDVTRKRKWVSGFFNKRSAHNVKSPLSQGQQSNHLPKVSDGRASNVPRCKGRTTRDGEQCSFSVRPGHLLCTKHLMAAERGKKIAEGDSKTSSVSNAKALFESFLKSAEDISLEGPNGLVAKNQLLKFTRAEAAQDYCTAEELLKLVTLEMSKIEPILRPAQAGVHETKSEMKSVLPVLINGNVQGCHVPGTTRKVSREQPTSETCGLCGLSIVSKEGLGRHWKDSHRKEVILFVKGYACRACNQLYSRKHTVRRHWRKCHESLPVRSPDWMAVCSTCNSRFDHHDTLLQHVCTAHPDKLSSPALKAVALENRVGSPVADEAAETLECDDCHEEFNTHWDLFHHKESVHRTLNNDVVGTKLQSSGDTKPGDRENSSSASQSVPKFVVCRNCGMKFPSVSELGRHADTEHSIPPNLPGSPPPAAGPSGKSGLSSEACRLKLQVRRKSDEKVSGSWQPAGLGRRRSKKKGKFLKQPEKNPEIEKDALLKKMKTAVQTAQLRNLRQMKRAEAPAVRPRKALYSLTKGGQMFPFDGDSKSDNFPDDMELLGMAQSACCQSKLLTSLQKKGVKNPDQILARVSQVRTNANVKLEWLADGYLCPSGCKEPKHTAESVVCEPLMAVKGHETKVNERDVGARRDYHSNSDQLDTKPTSVVISSDLSNGQEPVPVVCSVDQDVVDSWRRTHRDESSSSESFRPDSFNYITKRFLNPSLCLDPESFKLGCSCQGHQCSPESCEHVDFFDNDNLDALDIYGQPMKGRFPYDKQGCIILEEGYIAYECNSKCHCQQACQNRVLQKGVTVKLEVFRTLQKGWAVRAAQRIPRGTFVCEYLGEVLRDEEAQRRGERYDQVGCSYLYDIDAHLDTSRRARRTKPFVIDATKHGNVARFINHSCSPNLVNYQVLVETMDYQMAHIGLFASRDIESGEELAYDYRYKLLPGKGCPCHCGAPNCRGRLY